MKKALMIGALVLSVVALTAVMPSSSMAWFGGHGCGCGGYAGYGWAYPAGYGGYGWGYYGDPSYYGGWYGGRGWYRGRGYRDFYGRGRRR